MKREHGYVLAIVVVVLGGIYGVAFVPNQAALIVLLGVLVCIEMLGLLQGSRAADKAAIAALEVVEVAARVREVARAAEGAAEQVSRIETAVNETREVAKSSHTLINGNMEIQLMHNAELSALRAELQPSPENAEKARNAALLLVEHRANQVQADVVTPPAGFGDMPEKTEAEKASAEDVKG